MNADHQRLSNSKIIRLMEVQNYLEKYDAKLSKIPGPPHHIVEIPDSRRDMVVFN